MKKILIALILSISSAHLNAQHVTKSIQGSDGAGPVQEAVPHRVVIWHIIGENGAIENVQKDTVLQHGLCSRNELYAKGFITRDPEKIATHLPGQFNSIYFSYLIEPVEATNENVVGFLVDPYSTYVYNREYRYDANKTKYNASEVLLATYIANLKKALQMKRSAPLGKQVIFNPLTSDPFYVDYDDKRFNDPKESSIIRDMLIEEDDYDGPDQPRHYNGPEQPRHYAFNAEIIIPQACISPEQLIFSKKMTNPVNSKAIIVWQDPHEILGISKCVYNPVHVCYYSSKTHNPIEK